MREHLAPSLLCFAISRSAVFLEGRQTFGKLRLLTRGCCQAIDDAAGIVICRMQLLAERLRRKVLASKGLRDLLGAELGELCRPTMVTEIVLLLCDLGVSEHCAMKSANVRAVVVQLHSRRLSRGVCREAFVARRLSRGVCRRRMCPSVSVRNAKPSSISQVISSSAYFATCVMNMRHDFVALSRLMQSLMDDPDESAFALINDPETDELVAIAYCSVARLKGADA